MSYSPGPGFGLYALVYTSLLLALSVRVDNNIFGGNQVLYAPNKYMGVCFGAYSNFEFTSKDTVE